MYIHELPDLKNEIENLIIEDPSSIWDTEDYIDFLESCFDLLECYIDSDPTLISEPSFHDDLKSDLYDFLTIQFEDHINDSFFEGDIHLLVDDILELFIESYSLSKSISSSSITPQDINKLARRIDYLRSVPQHAQRTPEWYENRHKLITASNAYKAFEKESIKNQLIYEKCKPIVQIESDKPTIVDSPMHWGQKYEPVSVQIYEYLYNTKVEDFGCIPHEKYSFLGASPDGIVVNKESERYGRMLEIKNVVSRLITGIPKKEYWIQMQLQMEVCDLDYCDFLETKFIELANFYTYQNEADKSPCSHGIILYFSRNKKPFYVYKPLNIGAEEEELWIEEKISFYTKNDEYIWIKTIYWKLDILSCVLIERNKDWFRKNIHQLQSVWETIVYEREHGYSHRMAKSSLKKNDVTSQSGNCFLNVIKIDTEKFNQ